MTLQLDNENNLVYTQTGITYTDGDAALLQDITNKLRLLPGEYLLNTAEGVDYTNYNDLNSLLNNKIVQDRRVAYIEIKRNDENIDIFIKSRDY